MIYSSLYKKIITVEKVLEIGIGCMKGSYNKIKNNEKRLYKNMFNIHWYKIKWFSVL